MEKDYCKEGLWQRGTLGKRVVRKEGLWEKGKCGKEDCREERL